MTSEQRAELLAILGSDPWWLRQQAKIASQRMPPRMRQNRLDAVLERLAIRRGLLPQPERAITYSDAGIV